MAADDVTTTLEKLRVAITMVVRELNAGDRAVFAGHTVPALLQRARDGESFDDLMADMARIIGQEIASRN